MRSRSARVGKAGARVQALEPRRMLAGNPAPDHIVVVVEENHSFASVIGSPEMPFLNSLARQGALYTQSHGLFRPSQPNYLALFSGSNQGVLDNGGPYDFVGVRNLGGELIKKGRTFVGYAQGLPEVGSKVFGEGKYDRKHNPWVNFDDVPDASNRPFTDFPTDYSTLPTVAFVVPDEDHNSHDGPIEAADQFLGENLASYATWAKAHNSLLIVTWDEGNLDDGTNHIATVVYGAGVRQGAYEETIGHYNVLRTLTDFYGIAPIADSAGVAPMDFAHGAGRPDLTAASDTGADPEDELTRDDTPTFTGVATPGVTVRLLSDGAVVGTSVASATDGTYAVTASPLADGTHEIRAAVDYQGYTVSHSEGLSVTVDRVPPRVTGVRFDGRTAGGSVHRVAVAFDGAVRVGLTDFSVRADAAGSAAVPGAKMSMTYDGATDVATWSFPGYRYGMLPDGNYTGTVRAVVTDLAGNALDGDGNGAGGDAVTVQWHQLAGDANGDRVVDRNDFYMLYVANTAPAISAAADFNSDGRVDIIDFQIYQGNYGAAVPAVGPVPAVAAAGKAAKAVTMGSVGVAPKPVAVARKVAVAGPVKRR